MTQHTPDCLHRHGYGSPCGPLALHSLAGRRSVLPLATALLTVLLLLSGSPLLATSFIMPSDESLVDQTTLILTAKILSVEPTPGSSLPATDLLLEIRQVHKGFPPGSVIVTRTIGGVRPDGIGLKIWGMPLLRTGDEALFFLQPRNDGTFALTQAMLGVFQIETWGSRRVALRDLGETHELQPKGAPAARKGPRDLDTFTQWIADRAEGRARPKGYFLGPHEGQPPASKFFLNVSSSDPPPLGCGANGSRPLRWFDFDQGSAVQWHAHDNGQDGLRGGGETPIQRALNAWSGDPKTPIRLEYAGRTDASRGFLGPDGKNTILFNDPNDSIAGSFPGAGILALAGPWFLCDLEEHGGQSYHRILEADIITQDGLGAFFSQVRDPRRSAEELFAHELGHTLGLGHSAEPEALMSALIHGDLRGAAPAPDDLSATLSVYGKVDPSTVQIPQALMGLAALSDSPSQVHLSWNNASEQASSIRIERNIDGVFEVIGSAPGESEHFFENGLQPNTNFIYRARAVNAAGYSTYTMALRVRTLGDPRPDAPSNLRIASLGASRLRLSWQDNSIDEAEFLVEIRTLGPFIEIPIALPPDTREINLSGLEPSTDYSIRLRTANAFGESAYSNTASAKTFAPEAPCTTDAETLCLLGGRFAAKVYSFTEAQSGEATPASAIPSSNISGYFRLVAESAVSLTLRMIDGREHNGHFWLYSTGLSKAEYWLSLRDMVSGEEKLYHHPAGEQCGINDPRAFADTNPAAASALTASAAPRLPKVSHFSFDGGQGVDDKPLSLSKRYCRGDSTLLCLNRSRFAVEIDWKNQYAAGKEGKAQAIVGDGETGFFWFFDPDDTLLMVRIEDRAEETGHYEVSFASLTNVEYSLRVSDTISGREREYFNPPGSFCGQVDSLAFPAP